MKIVKLCCNSWAGYSEHPVELVGETPKRYRIRAINRTKLGGRCRWLARGEIALVPKRAVRIELGYGGVARHRRLRTAGALEQEKAEMGNKRLEETKVFVRRVLALFPSNAAIDDTVIEDIARKIAATFLFLDKRAP